MVTTGRVGHTGHSVLFATLEDPLNTGLLVEFLVLCTNFSWRTIDDNICDRKRSDKPLCSRTLQDQMQRFCLLHRTCSREDTFPTARSQPKDGLVFVTPIISMSSCASIASATRFPIVPYPLIATLTTILLNIVARLNIHKQFVPHQFNANSCFNTSSRRGYLTDIGHR